MMLLIGYLVTLFFNIIMFVILLLAAKYYGGVSYTISTVNADLSTAEKEIYSTQFWEYCAWALIQQSLIIGCFSLFKCINFPMYYCYICCSFIMMFMHVPNVVLMFAVLGMEFFLIIMFSVLGWWFIPAMCITHGWLAVCLYTLFPSDFVKQFKVLWSFYAAYKK